VESYDKRADVLWREEFLEFLRASRMLCGWPFFVLWSAAASGSPTPLWISRQEIPSAADVGALQIN